MESCLKIHVTSHGHGHNWRVMRLLLAMLALVGLLMTPAVASAGAAACFGHGDRAIVASAGDSVADHTEHEADHSCCDPQGAPDRHDSQACAKACAAMCVTTAALSDTAAQAPAPLGSLAVETMPPKAFHAHAPPGLKRPPRTLA